MKSVIGELIEQSGFKKKYIAKKMGVSDDTLTSWIKGKTWPRLNQAVALADLLDCDVNDLFERNEELDR